MPRASIDDIKAKVGQETGLSPWIEISQRDIDRFADVTGDFQFIHVDPEAAALTPFGSTIAQGFLTLSLLTQMAESAALFPDEMKMVVNYGLERVRFVSPVKSGKRVRGRFTLASFEESAAGQWRTVHRVLVEIEGEERPALHAEWIGLIFT